MKVSGTKLKEYREQANLRMADVAVSADLGERRIAQIESGEIVNVNLNIAKAIAKRIGVKLSDIAV